MVNFLDKLGISGGIDVHVCVSAISGLEMITTDQNGNIKSYAQIPLEYNETLREVASYDTLGSGIKALFEMRNIDPKRCNVYLSLPTVWFGLKEGLPLLLADDSLTNVIMSELDETYIFKQKEATPYWFDAPNQDANSRSIFYTAIQTEAIDEIKKIFTRLGANLVSIECSLISDLKGLYAANIATTQMNDNNAYWTLMIINNSGFQVIELQCRKILKFYEEPLPLKTYEGDELYNSLESALQIALMDSQSNSLVLISSTDLVSADILSKKVSFGGSVKVVDNNNLKKEPLTQMSLNIVPQDQIKVSLSALGSSASEDLLPININFLVASGQKVSKNDTIEIPFGRSVIRLTPIKASIVALGAFVLILGPIVLGNFITKGLLDSAQKKGRDLDTQIQDLDSKLAQYQNKEGDTTFDPVREIEKVLKNNRTKIMAYTALGDSIPKNIYLTYFVVSDDGLINIRGCAESVEDVYVFFKSMKDSLFESKLRLSKLDLKSGSLDTIVNGVASEISDAPYVFEITNMDENQLKTFMDNLVNASNNNSNNNANNPNNTGANENPPQQ